MRELTAQEMSFINGGESAPQQFDNMDVALTFAGFIAPLLINSVTIIDGGATITGISFANFFWSPAAATMGLIFSKTLKKIDSLFA